MEKKANHRVNVVRIGEIHSHPNADKLSLTFVGGYQCVIGKGTMKTGELAVFVQPDSVIPQTEPFRFIWQDHVGLDGIVPEKRRRITCKRLRKEWSEGLLLPLSDFGEKLWCGATEFPPYHGAWIVKEGQDVSDILGITHWDPEANSEEPLTRAKFLALPKRRYPKSLKGWFYFFLHKLRVPFLKDRATRALALDVSFTFPVYDVEALKNFKNALVPGETVRITEKIHGSNARYTEIDGVQYCGSRQQWKADGNNVWWNAYRQIPEIGRWCKENPGQVLYGEVVPTQGGYKYGCTEGKVRFFAFDAYNDELRLKRGQPWYYPVDYEGEHVPTLYWGPWEEKCMGLAEGMSKVPGNTHMIREGCVVRPIEERYIPELGRVHLKIVSLAFLERDSKQ